MPPRRLRGKKGQQQEHKPRGPIKERSGGRIYAVDDLDDDDAVEIVDPATKTEDDVVDEVVGEDSGEVVGDDGGDDKD